MANLIGDDCAFCVPCFTVSGSLEIDTVTNPGNAEVTGRLWANVCKKDITCKNKRTQTKIRVGPFSRPTFIPGDVSGIFPPRYKVTWGPIKVCLGKLPSIQYPQMSLGNIGFTKDRVCCNGVKNGLSIRRQGNPEKPSPWPELEEKCTPCCEVMYEMGEDLNRDEVSPGCKGGYLGNRNWTIPSPTFQGALNHQDMRINLTSQIWNRLSSYWNNEFFDKRHRSLLQPGSDLPPNVFELGCGCPPQGKCCT